MKRLLVATALSMLAGCSPRTGDTMFVKTSWGGVEAHDDREGSGFYKIPQGTRLRFVEEYPKDKKTQVIVLEGKLEGRHLYIGSENTMAR